MRRFEIEILMDHRDTSHDVLVECGVPIDYNVESVHRKCSIDLDKVVAVYETFDRDGLIVCMVDGQNFFTDSISYERFVSAWGSM